MEKTFEGTSHMICWATPTGFLKDFGWGFIGDLTGTLVMGLMLMGNLLVPRQHATLCFSFVRNPASRFFAVLDAKIAGGVPTRVATYYVVDPLIGILFGAALTKLPILRGGYHKKIMIAAFVYVEWRS